MRTNIPATSAVLASLLRADFTTQWRNRRSVILILIVPVIILISWKGLIEKLGGAFVLSSCITVGLTAIGLMGYSNSIGRDRDKGVFQRLRVAPVPSWSIMVSRIFVQLFMILLVTVAVFLAGYYFDKITLSPAGYLFGILTSFVGGALYLGLGQAIVGLIKNAETVNSVTRLVYFLFIMIGMFGELGVLGQSIGEAVKWSPYGTVKRILSASMQPGNWDQRTSIALLVTVGYAFAFSFLGIRWFRWNPR
ncbi:MAG TPA: ABC transporter permease [Puia sp.]|nr:ABC transporter permease [Puia sp.]